MGAELLVGPEDAETEAYYLGSNSRVMLLMDWIRSLPAGKFPLLGLFAEEFRTTEPDELSSQLADARDWSDPNDEVRAMIYEVGSTA